MKSPRARPLLFALILLLLEGCAHLSTEIAPPRPATFMDWLPALRERSEHWKTYQAKIQLRAATADKRLNLNAVILARLPDQFRLEAFRLGQTVGVLTIDPGQSSLLVPSEKTFYSSDESEVLIDRLFVIAIPLEAFGYSLSGSLPPDQLESLQIISHDPEFMGYPKPSPDGWSFAWQFLSSPQTIKSARVKQGARAYTIQYDPPVGLAVKDVPQKITFASSQWQIDVTVQEITPDPDLQDSVFHTNVVGQIRNVKLNRIE